MIYFIISGILYLLLVYFMLSLYYNFKDLEKLVKDKEGDNMACKKGRGGRKK